VENLMPEGTKDMPERAEEGAEGQCPSLSPEGKLHVHSEEKSPSPCAAEWHIQEETVTAFQGSLQSPEVALKGHLLLRASPGLQMVLESGLQQCHPEGDELGDELGDEDPPCGYHSLGSELCIAVACSTPFEVQVGLVSSGSPGQHHTLQANFVPDSDSGSFALSAEGTMRCTDGLEVESFVHRWPLGSLLQVWLRNPTDEEVAIIGCKLDATSRYELQQVLLTPEHPLRLGPVERAGLTFCAPKGEPTPCSLEVLAMLQNKVALPSVALPLHIVLPHQDKLDNRKCELAVRAPQGAAIGSTFMVDYDLDLNVQANGMVLLELEWNSVEEEVGPWIVAGPTRKLVHSDEQNVVVKYSLIGVKPGLWRVPSLVVGGKKIGFDPNEGMVNIST